MLTKKSSIILITVALVGLGLIAAYFFLFKNSVNENIAEQQNQDTVVDTANPSDESQTKEKASERMDKDKESNNNDLKKVTPVITSYGQSESIVEVSARVPNIFEEGGICTLVLTKDSKRVTKQSKAVTNVSEVSCGFISIPVSKLEPGQWSAAITYKSKTAEGVSEHKKIEVK